MIEWLLKGLNFSLNYRNFVLLNVEQVPCRLVLHLWLSCWFRFGVLRCLLKNVHIFHAQVLIIPLIFSLTFSYITSRCFHWTYTTDASERCSSKLATVLDYSLIVFCSHSAFLLVECCIYMILKSIFSLSKWDRVIKCSCTSLFSYLQRLTNHILLYLKFPYSIQSELLYNKRTWTLSLLVLNAVYITRQKDWNDIIFVARLHYLEKEGHLNILAVRLNFR